LHQICGTILGVTGDPDKSAANCLTGNHPETVHQYLDLPKAFFKNIREILIKNKEKLRVFLSDRHLGPLRFRAEIELATVNTKFGRIDSPE
jgi:hypothetical protein